METEHFKNKIVLYNKGANTDVDPELTFSQENQEEYLDARNARPVSIDGNTGALEKITGEEIIYPNTLNLPGYVCVGKCSCNNHVIEVYAPTVAPFEGIIRIDGVICLRSDKFEQRVDYPLQMDVNESALAGEIFLTDNRVPPYIFNVQDMIDSLVLHPNRYFSAFNPLLYQINLQLPMDTMVFIDLVSVGGGGGLAVGSYQYQMRYTTKDGDRTNWSHPTPMIPVMESLSSSSREYPWIKTYGGPPAPSSLTAYAPRLRFRVTNLNNYDFIEVKRISYNSGAGLDFTPNGVIVAKIDISAGEISVREYIDPVGSNSNIALSAEDETSELSEVERAKSIRYFDKRVTLMNVKLSPKESNLSFLRVNDKTGWPVIDKLGKPGHKDPWNHVYRRSHMRGEIYGYGIGLYDGVGTKGFTIPVEDLTNFQHPNRRDVIATETANYSYFGTSKAADSTASNAVSQTHEVFDHYEAVWKTNHCDFKNIHEKGRVIGATGTRLVIKVTADCPEDNGEIESHGAEVSGAGFAAAVSVSYQPFNPVRQGDPDVSGHNYVVNTKVFTTQAEELASSPPPSSTSINSGGVSYRPSCFAPDYYSQGMMIAGVDNFPKWCKAFSVVRTKAARRVVCQGIGWYAMTQARYSLLGSQSLGGKEPNKFWFHSSDVENGIVSSDAVNDMIANPQNFKIQCVAPLGFFSEVYSFEDGFLDLGKSRDRLVDMIAYARLLRDHASDINTQINPKESVNMGVPGGDGYNYVAYDLFRNSGQNPNTFGGHPDKGNRLLDIAAIRRKSDGRGSYLEIETIDNIYGKNTAGGQADRNFEDSGMKDWTEPVYMVNIIKPGAEIRDQNIQKYLQTDHYQKLESIIGLSSGDILTQKYLLVDERWEDCIPAPNSGLFGANTDRYIYVRIPDEPDERWINVTYKTTTQINAIKADIMAYGSWGPNQVKGMYRHNNIGNGNRYYEILFNVTGFDPPQDALIIVKYDNTAPIRFYGGDTFIGESIFAPIDKESNAKDDAAETQFAWGLGLPYFMWRLNPRYYTIRKAGASINAIQDELEAKLKYLRQLCVMYTVESRIACHLAFNQPEPPAQFFPLIHYVIRPNRWDPDKDLKGNSIYQDYEDDYGTQEKDMWKWGGFRFLQQMNSDYSVEPRISFFSKPKFGFVEKTIFPTRIMWSLARPINIQDTPGLKTFPANNHYDIDDDQGEIKYAYECMSDRGENLYAFTNKGVCFLVTRKSVLSDLGGGDIGYMAADSFVKQQMWLSKETGMQDEWWRSAAEGYVPIQEGDAPEVRQEAIFFGNNESVYMFSNNILKDIGRLKYYNKVYHQGLSKVGPKYDTWVTGVYDKKYQEYWLHIKGEVDNTFVFGKKNMAWIGTYDFKFEQMVVSKFETYGVRNMETFLLHKGYIINGQPIQFEAMSGCSQDQFWDKEFCRVRVNSLDGIKPTRVEFYKKFGGVIQCELDPSQGSYYMKNYRGFEQYIPRINASVNANRPRFQGRLIIFKIIHNLASEFKVIDSSIFYKLLK